MPTNGPDDRHFLPPKWFDVELEKLAASLREASRGNVVGARNIFLSIRSDDLREWYVEHGQNSGAFRFRGFGKRPAAVAVGPLDPKRQPSERAAGEIFQRDGYRCRYCNQRLVSKFAFNQLAKVLGADVLRTVGTNQERHGTIVAFRPVADHVLDWKHGGRTAPNNLVTACWSCNFGKYYFSLEQLGIDDPRLRQPINAAGWDGLMADANKIRRFG